jgi:cytochrome c oxidase cbb3-type subunit 3
MNTPRPAFYCILAFTVVVSIAIAVAVAQTPPQQAGTEAKQSILVPSTKYPQDVVQKGRTLFRADCSFCHGRDAGGGESGPDLTRSKLVAADVDGDKIGPVIRNGRPDKGMPPFDRSDDQIFSLVAFIHTQQERATAGGGRNSTGGRKGVDPSDLQTGNVDAGKQYFNGAGGCARCHSPRGDLAGIASRYKGLELEEQMLYPKNAKSKVSVTLASGQTFDGTLEYLDEFTVGLIDATGTYRSWRIRDVRYKVDAPVDAHVDLFSKYTDADVHNLMAYLQTLQ